MINKVCSQCGCDIEPRGLINYSRIPDRLMNGMIAYVDEHRLPGHFLQAVISNDLSEAVGRADDESIMVLKDIVGWFYNIAPGICWGSKEKMKEWVKDE